MLSEEEEEVATLAEPMTLEVVKQLEHTLSPVVTSPASSLPSMPPPPPQPFLHHLPHIPHTFLSAHALHLPVLAPHPLILPLPHIPPTLHHHNIWNPATSTTTHNSVEEDDDVEDLPSTVDIQALRDSPSPEPQSVKLATINENWNSVDDQSESHVPSSEQNHIKEGSTIKVNDSNYNETEDSEDSDSESSDSQDSRASSRSHLSHSSRENFKSSYRSRKSTRSRSASLSGDDSKDSDSESSVLSDDEDSGRNTSSSDLSDAEELAVTGNTRSRPFPRRKPQLLVPKLKATYMNALDRPEVKKAVSVSDPIQVSSESKTCTNGVANSKNSCSVDTEECNPIINSVSESTFPVSSKSETLLGSLNSSVEADVYKFSAEEKESYVQTNKSSTISSLIEFSGSILSKSAISLENNGDKSALKSGKGSFEKVFGLADSLGKETVADVKNSYPSESLSKSTLSPKIKSRIENNVAQVSKSDTSDKLSISNIISRDKSVYSNDKTLEEKRREKREEMEREFDRLRLSNTKERHKEKISAMSSENIKSKSNQLSECKSHNLDAKILECKSTDLCSQSKNNNLIKVYAGCRTKFASDVKVANNTHSGRALNNKLAYKSSNKILDSDKKLAIATCGIPKSSHQNEKENSSTSLSKPNTSLRNSPQLAQHSFDDALNYDYSSEKVKNVKKEVKLKVTKLASPVRSDTKNCVGGKTSDELKSVYLEGKKSILAKSKHVSVDKTIISEESESGTIVNDTRKKEHSSTSDSELSNSIIQPTIADLVKVRERRQSFDKETANSDWKSVSRRKSSEDAHSFTYSSGSEQGSKSTVQKNCIHSESESLVLSSDSENTSSKGSLHSKSNVSKSSEFAVRSDERPSQDEDDSDFTSSDSNDSSEETDMKVDLDTEQTQTFSVCQANFIQNDLTSKMTALKLAKFGETGLKSVGRTALPTRSDLHAPPGACLDPSIKKKSPFKKQSCGSQRLENRPSKFKTAAERKTYADALPPPSHKIITATDEMRVPISSLYNYNQNESAYGKLQYLNGLSHYSTSARHSFLYAEDEDHISKIAHHLSQISSEQLTNRVEYDVSSLLPDVSQANNGSVCVNDLTEDVLTNSTSEETSDQEDLPDLIFREVMHSKDQLSHHSVLTNEDLTTKLKCTHGRFEEHKECKLDAMNQPLEKRKRGRPLKNSELPKDSYIDDELDISGMPELESYVPLDCNISNVSPDSGIQSVNGSPLHLVGSPAHHHSPFYSSSRSGTSSENASSTPAIHSVSPNLLIQDSPPPPTLVPEVTPPHLLNSPHYEYSDNPNSPPMPSLMCQLDIPPWKEEKSQIECQKNKNTKEKQQDFLEHGTFKKRGPGRPKKVNLATGTKKRGRPKGSKSKNKIVNEDPVKVPDDKICDSKEDEDVTNIENTHLRKSNRPKRIPPNIDNNAEADVRISGNGVPQCPCENSSQSISDTDKNKNASFEKTKRKVGRPRKYPKEDLQTESRLAVVPTLASRKSFSERIMHKIINEKVRNSEKSDKLSVDGPQDPYAFRDAPDMFLSFGKPKDRLKKRAMSDGIPLEDRRKKRGRKKELPAIFEKVYGSVETLKGKKNILKQSSINHKRKKKDKKSQKKPKNIYDPVFLQKLEELICEFQKCIISKVPYSPPDIKSDEVLLPAIFRVKKIAPVSVKKRRSEKTKTSDKESGTEGEAKEKIGKRKKKVQEMPKQGKERSEANEQRLPLKKRHRHISTGVSVSVDFSDNGDSKSDSICVNGSVPTKVPGTTLPKCKNGGSNDDDSSHKLVNQDICVTKDVVADVISSGIKDYAKTVESINLVDINKEIMSVGKSANTVSSCSDMQDNSWNISAKADELPVQSKILEKFSNTCVKSLDEPLPPLESLAVDVRIEETTVFLHEKSLHKDTANNDLLLKKADGMEEKELNDKNISENLHNSDIGVKTAPKKRHRLELDICMRPLRSPSKATNIHSPLRQVGGRNTVMQSPSATRVEKEKVVLSSSGTKSSIRHSPSKTVGTSTLESSPSPAKSTRAKSASPHMCIIKSTSPHSSPSKSVGTRSGSHSPVKSVLKGKNSMSSKWSTSPKHNSLSNQSSKIAEVKSKSHSPAKLVTRSCTTSPSKFSVCLRPKSASPHTSTKFAVQKLGRVLSCKTKRTKSASPHLPKKSPEAAKALFVDIDIKAEKNKQVKKNFKNRPSLSPCPKNNSSFQGCSMTLRTSPKSKKLSVDSSHILSKTKEKQTTNDECQNINNLGTIKDCHIKVEKPEMTKTNNNPEKRELHDTVNTENQNCVDEGSYKELNAKLDIKKSSKESCTSVEDTGTHSDSDIPSEHEPLYESDQSGFMSDKEEPIVPERVAQKKLKKKRDLRSPVSPNFLAAAPCPEEEQEDLPPPVKKKVKRRKVNKTGFPTIRKKRKKTRDVIEKSAVEANLTESANEDGIFEEALDNKDSQESSSEELMCSVEGSFKSRGRPKKLVCDINPENSSSVSYNEEFIDPENFPEQAQKALERIANGVLGRIRKKRELSEDSIRQDNKRRKTTEDEVEDSDYSGPYFESVLSSEPMSSDECSRIMLGKKKVPRWRKKYLVAGLFSDYYKQDEPRRKNGDLTVPKNKYQYSREEHIYGLLPPPCYCRKLLRERQVDFLLPYDLWWLHKHNMLPGRDIVPSWNYKKIKSNIYYDVKPSNTFDVQSCNCKRPAQNTNNSSDNNARLGCGEECINRMMFIECSLQTCPISDVCSNQRIQKHQSLTCIQKFMTEKKGWGVRSTQCIKQSTFIMEYIGEVVSEKEFKERMRTRYANDTHHYCLNLDRGMVIDGHRVGGDCRFVNHSCEPNCEMQKWYVNGHYRMALYALKNIRKGEELTYDYNFSLFNPAEGQPCKCGSPNCRGVIGGRSQRLNGGIRSSTEDRPRRALGRPKKDPGGGSVVSIGGVKKRKHNSVEVETNGVLAALRPLSPQQSMFIQTHRCFLLRNLERVRQKVKERYSEKKVEEIFPAPSVQSSSDMATVVEEVSNTRVEKFLTHFTALNTARSVKTRRLAKAEDDPEMTRVARLAQIFKDIYDKLVASRDEHKDQPLATPFMTLPSRKKRPTYYARVGEPIDLSTIEKNILTGFYVTADTFDRDINKLFVNNLRFYGRNSQIGQMALGLRKVYAESKLQFKPFLEEVLGENNIPAAFGNPSVIEDYEDEEIIRCVCNLHRDEGTMIQCEQCLVWQHWDCMGLTDSTESPDHYLCEECSPRIVSPEVPMIPQPADVPKGHKYFITLLRDNLQIKQGDSVYILRDRPPQKSGERRQPAYKLAKDLKSHDLLIFKVENLWIDEKGEKVAFGHHYLRPHETFHEPWRKFFSNEVIRSPLFDVLDLDMIVSHCWVLDLNTYCRGRPIGAVEEHVYVCEYRVDKSARVFSKISKPKYPVCTKGYAFISFPEKLKLQRTYAPHEVVYNAKGRSTPNNSTPKSVNFEIPEQIEENSKGNQKAVIEPLLKESSDAKEEHSANEVSDISEQSSTLDRRKKVNRINNILTRLLNKLPSKGARDMSFLLERPNKRQRKKTATFAS